MEIQLVYTTSSQIDNLPIVNGQVCVLTDKTAFYYDMGNARHVLTDKSVPELGFGYALCSTPSGTAAKVASIADYELGVGGLVAIRFSDAVDASSTLNISNKGAKPIYFRGSAITADVIGSGTTALMVYDGTNYNVVGLDNSSALSELSDVNITSPTQGQVLQYDATNDEWVNGTGGSSGDVADVTVNGVSVVDPVTKIAEVEVPVKVSDLQNDSGFITSTVSNLTNYYQKSETYTQSEVDALISAIITLDILVVQTLPTTDISRTTIYLVPKSTPDTQDVYDEYVNLDGTSTGWEHIGSTQIDLSNYYTKSQVDTLLASKVNIADLAEVATSGSYNDLSDKPTIPTQLSQLSTDSTHRVVTDTEKSTWNGKLSDNPTFTEASTRANIASGESFATILGKIKKFFTDLKTVAFTGSYNDLSNKPTIPAAQVNSDWNATSGVAQILNKPTIPTVNNATLTIQKNGTTVKTFTANASSNVTANITVPTKVSELTNDSGYITTDTNTHRPIQVNGTEILGDNTTALNLKAGSNVSLSNSSGTITIAATNTTYSAGTGISLSGTTFSNSGVRDISINGNYLRKNVNGTNTDLTIPFATNSTTASKLGSATVGSSVKGIYLNAGSPTAVSWYPNYCAISGGNKANYPWHRFATCTTGTGQYVDKDVIVILRSRYNGGAYGAIKLSVRTSSTGTAMSSSATWIYRYGFAVGDVVITSGGTTGTDTTFDAWVKCGAYPRRLGYVLEGSNNGWSLVNSNEVNDTTETDKKTSTEVFASVSGNVATDGVTVANANTVNNLTVQTAVPANAKFTDTDTKNTAGSTDTSSKIFLIGATSQAANPQTYSHDTAYVGTDGCLYSGGTKVLTAHQSITGKVDKKTTLDTYYGTCSTAAATAAKVITVTDGASNFSLRAGITIVVKFTYTNTASNPTFNVNSTGAKSVWYNTALITTGSLGYAGTANRPMQFTYDGTQWVFVGWSYDANTTYSAMSVSELTTGTATTSRVVRADYLKDGIEAIAMPLSGGTMTGELKTSYLSAVAMGTREGANHTIPNLCGELRYSSGCAGSVSITTAYTSGSVTIPTGWYNYLWIPHRSGGLNGAANGDNCDYGTLYLTGMTAALGFYMVRYSSAAIAEVSRFAGEWSASVSAAANATSCTISDSRITTSSNLEPFSSNSGGYTVNITRMVVSAGKVVLYFNALSQATSFKVRIS